MKQSRKQGITCRWSPIVCGLALAVLLGTMATGEARGAGITTRVNVDSSGNQALNWNSYLPSISADGRYVAFESLASNLVAGDTNLEWDVFVHDRQTGQTTRVSVDSSGNQGNNDSTDAMISADGRYVTFGSNATNLVAGDTNGQRDVFVHDRQTGQTTRVSVDSAGNQVNVPSGFPSINADGRFVGFSSSATNLVPGDTNGIGDLFVHDRQTGQTTRVNVDSAGNQANFDSGYTCLFSADGRYVAFESLASNLVAGDTNNDWDVFVHDRQTGQTTRVSVGSSGNEADGDSYHPSISADGRYVAFGSNANNLVPSDVNLVGDIFVHDRQTGQTTRVNLDNAGNQWQNFDSGSPWISADGRYVTFTSDGGRVFLRDRQTGQTTGVSLSSSGGLGVVSNHMMSADGRHVVFESELGMVIEDTNGRTDIYVHSILLKSQINFDSDGLSDIAVYRPTTGVWYILQSTDAYNPSLYKAYSWGGPTDIPVPGDFDGDGLSDIAVYRPTTGVWYILQSTDAYNPSLYKAYSWGGPTDTPVPGDFDGDGLSDIAVYRPTTGVWYVLQSTDAYNPSLYKAYSWGGPTDTPVPGDFDGDGLSDIAVYRPTTGVWYVLQSTDAYNPSLYKAYSWGGPTDTPVPGDFDGDGLSDIAVYRPTTGVWYVLQSTDAYNPSLYKAYSWGGPTDTPVPGDFDGDGKTDIAVYRPTTGVWYVVRSSDGGTTSQQWGVSGDKPINRPTHLWGSP